MFMYIVLYCLAKYMLLLLSRLLKQSVVYFGRNILLTGGNCNIPGFRDRVFSEVRSMAPAEYEVKVTLADK